MNDRELTLSEIFETMNTLFKRTLHILKDENYRDGKDEFFFGKKYWENRWR